MALDVFKETTQTAILNELKATNALVSILAHGYEIESPQALKELAASGQIRKWLTEGDVIFIPWTDYSVATPVEYSVANAVVYIGDAYDEHDVKHENALWLMPVYCTPFDTVFDAAEDTVVNIAEEPNALEGWYYWGLDGADTYTALDLSAGDAIPTTHASVHKCGINSLSVLRYGYNRWRDSAYRQYLNSDVGPNVGWWTSTHLGDKAPAAAQTNRPGYIYGFPAEWQAIFQNVRVQTATNTVTDGGVTDVTYDKFFLPSSEQMYGAPQAAGVEGDYWPYWKEETGLPAPSNGSSTNTNEARKIARWSNPSGAAASVRLRSASRGSSTSVWSVATAGYLNSSYANASHAAQPACVIF